VAYWEKENLNKIEKDLEHMTANKAKKNPVRIIIWLITISILFSLPYVLPNQFYLRLVNEMLIFGLLAMSLDVLLGYTGLLSFMHTSYLGLAAYTTGLFLKHCAPNSLWLGILVGVIFVLIIAIPVGWIQVRTGGLAFALLTIAFGMMYFTVVWKWYDVTGGDDGLMGVPHPDISIFGLNLGNTSDPTTIYFFSLIIVLLCFVITRRIMYSPFGAVLQAIRENEERVAFIGINVHRFKLFGWLLACILAAIAGSLFILYRGYIGPTTMDAFAGAAVLMMVLLGGMGTLWGPLIGSAIFIYLKDYISTMTEHWELFVGLIVMLLVIFLPKGFAGLTKFLKNT